MAWTDQCKVAFKTNAEVLLWRQEKKTKKGIMKILKGLAEESGIPQKTLYHWWNELEKEKQENLKNQTNLREGITTENNSEKKDNKSSEICVKCHIYPKSKGRNDCSDCNFKTVRENKLKALKSAITQVNNIKNNILRDAQGKWNYKIYKKDYQQFINILTETIKVWQEVSK